MDGKNGYGSIWFGWLLIGLGEMLDAKVVKVALQEYSEV